MNILYRHVFSLMLSTFLLLRKSKLRHSKPAMYMIVQTVYTVHYKYTNKIRWSWYMYVCMCVLSVVTDIHIITY